MLEQRRKLLYRMCCCREEDDQFLGISSQEDIQQRLEVARPISGILLRRGVADSLRSVPKAWQLSYRHRQTCVPSCVQQQDLAPRFRATDGLPWPMA